MFKRIKRPLIAFVSFLVGFLVFLIWLNAIRNVASEYRTLAAADQAAKNNELLDSLLQAGQNLSFERGRTNVLLNADGIATEEQKTFVYERRRAVAEYLDHIIQSDAPGMSNEAMTVWYDYANIENLRKKVDEALLLEKGQRDPLLISRWYETLTKTLADIGTMALADTIARTEDAGPMASLNRLKILSFDLRTSLGTEATRIAEVLSADRLLTTEESERIENLRGQVEALWKSLLREAGLEDNTGIHPALQNIERKVFMTFRPIQNVVLGALKKGEKSPYELQKVLQASVPALDSVAQFLDILTRETDQHIQEIKNKTLRSFIASILEATLSLVVGLVAIYLFIVRLIIPLRKISIQLEQLAAGNLDVDLANVTPDKNDEISRTWAALQSFRESLIERRQLEARLRDLSNLDGLTGIPNRRALDAALESEWRREKRTNEPIALAMIDVDYFKKYNDRYGHIAGDDCLRKIAAVLQKNAQRAGDFVGRFGGEEFVALLPGLGREESFAWADRLRQDIEQAAIPHEDSATGCITVSIGIVSITAEKAGNMLEIIRLADKALYRAKAGGRNRVESANRDA